MFKELELNYCGKQYRVKPTMDLIRRLELAGLSPFTLAGHVHRRDQCFATYAAFVAEVLRFAGASVTDDQIYATLTSSDSMLDLVALVQTMVAAILPPSPVPVDGGAASPKKRAPRSASGSRQPQ